ncbi:competence protein CoiA [Embleya sp. NPDC008237]|uniref:competence protein CoiA family protein n=1 Tax=Embleya sp. NPDC008237 TaxID=3363978 RepID=UPI0036E736EA
MSIPGGSVAFRAVHEQWGTVFAHLPDLGCGRGWEAVWRVRPRAPVVCDECGHPMIAKTSRAGLRFFAHAPGAPACALGLESLAHHLLKLELAGAARDAGAHAELEVRGPDGSWRADVLAGDPAGTWRTALEAQLSPLTDADITARTERMRADGVTSIWFSDRARPPWLGTVPSIRLATRDGDAGLVVAEGLVKFRDARWRSAPQVPVADFLRWAFTGKVVPHAPRTHLEYPLRQLSQVWTAPQYIAAEHTHLAEEERRRRLQEEQTRAREQAREKKRDGIRARNAVSRAKALAEATAAEQLARLDREREPRPRPGVERALSRLAHEHDVVATVGWSMGDSRYADGVPLVDENGVPAAVFAPEPRHVRGDAYLLLADLLLVFRTPTDVRRFENAMKRAKHWPVDGFRTDSTDADPPNIPHRDGTCTCAVPQLVARIARIDYPAEPSEQIGPAAALYLARCRGCGRRYSGPWRRTTGNRTPETRPGR